MHGLRIGTTLAARRCLLYKPQFLMLNLHRPTWVRNRLSDLQVGQAISHKLVTNENKPVIIQRELNFIKVSYLVWEILSPT